MIRTTVVDQAEIGAGEFRIGGHLNVQAGLRFFTSQTVPGHQSFDLHFARHPHRDRTRIPSLPSNLKKQRDFHQDQIIFMDSITNHKFIQTPFHRRMYQCIQGRKSVRAFRR